MFAVGTNGGVARQKRSLGTFKTTILDLRGQKKDARIKVTEKLLNWANLIFVMEKRHKQRLNEKFGVVIADKKIVILDIEDNYQYMDAELIETLKLSVAPYLGGSDEDHQIANSDSLE